MPYIPHTPEDVARILGACKISTIEELLERVIPAELRAAGPLDLPGGLAEQELAGELSRLASKNTPVDEYSSFLGAGAYNHYVPAVVDALASRSEFSTAYTPYQPEVSQGTLQAVFEYQTLVCQLTGMDVSNSSLYDGASSVAEAVLMARRVTGRDRVVVSSALHPEYRQTLKTYLSGAGDHVSEIAFSPETGRTPAAAAEEALGADPAALVVQHPNFFGCLEDLEDLARAVHARKGLLVVVVTEPVSLGLLRPPGELGADIAVGENQSFGAALNFGGPYLGFMATKDRFVRHMPGRLVGRTVDHDGKRAFCLTLATREQHIRRNKATSNICSNQGLCALAAAIHLVSIGKAGLRKLALVNLSKAAYLSERLTSVAGVEAAFTGATFNEFTVRFPEAPEPVLGRLLEKGIVGGLALGGFYPGLTRHALVAATEMNTREEIEEFAGALAGCLA
ncbi:MAG: aminomethyl-transferring glycine dehydrogenase subunit GcvPA [Thermodesulfobacteriota bacterium]